MFTKPAPLSENKKAIIDYQASKRIPFPPVTQLHDPQSEVFTMKLGKYDISANKTQLHIRDIESKKEMSDTSGWDPRVILSSDENILVSTGWFYTASHDDFARAELQFWNVAEQTRITKSFEKSCYCESPIISIPHNRAVFCSNGSELEGFDIIQEAKSSDRIKPIFTIKPPRSSSHFDSLLSIPHTDLIVVSEIVKSKSQNNILIYDVSTHNPVLVDEIKLEQPGVISKLKLLPNTKISFELTLKEDKSREDIVTEGKLQSALITSRIRQGYQQAQALSKRSITEAQTPLVNNVQSLVSEYLIGEKPKMIRGF